MARFSASAVVGTVVKPATGVGDDCRLTRDQRFIYLNIPLIGL